MGAGNSWLHRDSRPVWPFARELRTKRKLVQLDATPIICVQLIQFHGGNPQCESGRCPEGREMPLFARVGEEPNSNVLVGRKLEGGLLVDEPMEYAWVWIKKVG